MSYINTAAKIIEDINTKYPVNLSKHQELIDYVHDRYPLAGKHQISLIIREFITVIREILIKGDAINIYGVFNKVRLCARYYIIDHARKISVSSILIKMATPIAIREHIDE